jgi:hypothetical protein
MGLSNLGFELVDSHVVPSPKLEFIIDNFEYEVVINAYVRVDAQATVALYEDEQRVC